MPKDIKCDVCGDNLSVRGTYLIHLYCARCELVPQPKKTKQMSNDPTNTYLDDGAFPDEVTKDYTRGGRLLAALEAELDGTVEAIEDEITLPYVRVLR